MLAPPQLDYCRGNLTACADAKLVCDGDLITRTSSLTTCATTLDTCNGQKDVAQAQVRWRQPARGQLAAMLSSTRAPC